MHITSSEQLGLALRATRVALNVPLADLAETLHTSQTLLRRQETGPATIAVEKLFAIMAELGIQMHLRLPADIDEMTIDLASPDSRRKRARP